jgi:phage major head subunit gpT-like protein
MITPTNWVPFITQANTSIRQAWSSLPIDYPAYTTTVTTTESIFEDGWIGRMPKVRLWSGPRVYNEAAPQTYQVVPEPFELSYTIDQFKWNDDGFGVFYPMLLDFALQTKKWPQYQMRDLIEASGAWASTQSQLGLDGLSFWNTAHQTNIYSLSGAGTLNAGTAYCNDFTGGGVSINGVTVGGALSQTSLLTLIEYMPTIRAEDGERLAVTMTHLMHPSTLNGQVTALLKNMKAAASVGYSTWGGAQTQVGASDNVVARMGVEPIENKDLASFTKWYGLDNSKGVKAFRWVLREAFDFVPLVEPSSPLVVSNHKFAWVGHGRGAPAWSPSWLAFRSGP